MDESGERLVRALILMERLCDVSLKLVDQNAQFNERLESLERRVERSRILPNVLIDVADANRWREQVQSIASDIRELKQWRQGLDDAPTAPSGPPGPA